MDYNTIDEAARQHPIDAVAIIKSTNPCPRATPSEITRTMAATQPCQQFIPYNLRTQYRR